MSHTNHTTNYNLPQFIGSDKASWLGDLNPAFETIDANMHAIDVMANDTDSKATAAQSSANNAIDLGQTAIANTSNLSEKLKIQKSTVEFTSQLKNDSTFSTNIMYIKSLGILYIKGYLKFDEQIISAGCVVGSLGNILKNDFKTNLYSRCLINLKDGSQISKWLQISNNVITLGSGVGSVDNKCISLSYDVMTMVDPVNFN